MIKQTLLALAFVVPIAATPVTVNHYLTSPAQVTKITGPQKDASAKAVKPKLHKVYKWNCDRIKHLTPAELQYGLAHVNADQIAQIKAQCGL